MKRTLLLIGTLLVATMAGLILLFRSRSLTRNKALLGELTLPAPLPTPAPAEIPVAPPTAPVFAFTGQTKYGYTDGEQIANHGTSYPIFARVVNHELYAVGINKTAGQALYNQPVRLSRAWLEQTAQFGVNTGAFADLPHQSVDPAPLSAFTLTLAQGTAATQPTGYTPPNSSPMEAITAPVVPPVTAPVVPPVAAPVTPPVTVPVTPPVAPTETAPPVIIDDFSLIPDFEAGLNGPTAPDPV